MLMANHLRVGNPALEGLTRRLGDFEADRLTSLALSEATAAMFV